MLADIFYYKSKYKKVGVLPIRIVKSNVLSAGPLSERRAFPRFYLTKGQRSKRQILLSVSAVHQPFNISICISTSAYAAHYVYFIFYYKHLHKMMFFFLYGTRYRLCRRRQYNNVIIYCHLRRRLHTMLLQQLHLKGPYFIHHFHLPRVTRKWGKQCFA